MKMKEIKIEYGKGKAKREYIQVLLPVRQAIQLRQQWSKSDGTIDELKMYDLVLANCFDKEYKLDDFVNVAEVDHITQQAVLNQYTDTGK